MLEARISDHLDLITRTIYSKFSSIKFPTTLLLCDFLAKTSPSGSFKSKSSLSHLATLKRISRLI